MVSRLYFEEYLSFEKASLDFKEGLVVFTGPSGSGKSIFFDMMVSLFGCSDASAKIAEIEINKISIQSDEFIIDNEAIIKQTKTNKARYFINNQSIAKSHLKNLTKSFFKHLHLKDTSDFENEKIIEFLNFLGNQNIIGYKELIDEFQLNYTELQTKQKEYKKICSDEEKIEELMEFARFEINKIDTINPQPNEYEELKEYKELFTKKEKLEEKLNLAKPIIDDSYKITNALQVLDIDSAFFDDTINEVQSYFEKFYDSLASMDDIDLDSTMERIDLLQKLIKKYGSIEEAIIYKKNKQKELESFENISFEKSILEKNLKKLNVKINAQAEEITKKRKELVKIFKSDMSKYLKELYLDGLEIDIHEKELDYLGKDSIVFTLHQTPLNKLSSGEFNRLRLSLITTRSIYETSNNGILFLDEIDANLSGKESESIGKVLKILSKNYQIFAISHQPQLSSLANQHFLIEKENDISYIREIDGEKRIQEISRMISGEDITNEAIEFAKKLLK